MIDSFGRNINYMRVSITDWCNLRCTYCQPNGIERLAHADILTYEEILRVCGIAATLGIDKFKVTGGDPLMRKGCMSFVFRLKHTQDVNSVTMTTNGLLIGEGMPELSAIDAVNISINAVDATTYRDITGVDGAKTAVEVVRDCADIVKTKVNCVLLNENINQIFPLLDLARDMEVDVRFIELMPLGCGNLQSGMSCEQAKCMIHAEFPDLELCEGKQGNGPAVYYKSKQLRGRIGFIAACSDKFCADCNRIRLTSTGFLKPCLCYNDGVDLRMLLRRSASDEDIKTAICDAILSKPEAHCFEKYQSVTERKNMSEIGG